MRSTPTRIATVRHGQLDAQPGESEPDHDADGRQDPDGRGRSDADDGSVPGQNDAGAEKADPRDHLADDAGRIGRSGWPRTGVMAMKT